MSNPKEWGPPFWRILHTLADRLGRQTNYIGIQDERRVWMLFLRSVELVLPCAKCKQHFRSWKQRHPVEQANSLAGEQLRSWAKEWFYSLHKEVNDEKDVISPDREEVWKLFQARTLRDQQDDIRFLNDQLLKAMQLRLVDPPVVHTFRNNLSMIQRLVF